MGATAGSSHAFALGRGRRASSTRAADGRLLHCTGDGTGLARGHALMSAGVLCPVALVRTGLVGLDALVAHCGLTRGTYLTGAEGTR